MRRVSLSWVCLRAVALCILGLTPFTFADPLDLVFTPARIPNPVVVPLWPSSPPGFAPVTEKEVYEPPTVDRNYSRLSNVHAPSLTVFLPKPSMATGGAIIIAPGGGHRILAIDHEGYDVATFFQERGLAAFVLKYRLAREEGSPYSVDHAIEDAHRAIRLVRSRAKEYRIDPGKIGIMGFSAGGEVAVRAATEFSDGKLDHADPIERVSSRPDYQVLIYPGARMESLKITENTPPAFLLAAYDDRGPSMTVAQLYLRLKDVGVSAELHVFSKGGHGFGMRPGELAVAKWAARVHEWLKDIGSL